MGWVWAGLKAWKQPKTTSFFGKNYSTLSLSLSTILHLPPLSLDSLSHILSLSATKHGDLRNGLAVTENQWGRFGLAASFFLSGFLFFSLGIFLSLRWAWSSLLSLPSFSNSRCIFLSLSSRFTASNFLICGHDFPKFFIATHFQESTRSIIEKIRKPGASRRKNRKSVFSKVLFCTRL